MAEGFTLDAIVQFAIRAKDEGIKTAEEQEQHIRSRLPVPTETQEELRAAFEEVLPVRTSSFPIRQRSERAD